MLINSCTDGRLNAWENIWDDVWVRFFQGVIILIVSKGIKTPNKYDVHTIMYDSCTSITYLQYWSRVKNKVWPVLGTWTAASMWSTEAGKPKLVIFLRWHFIGEPFTVQKLEPVWKWIEWRILRWCLVHNCTEELQWWSVPLKRKVVECCGCQ